MTYYNTNENRRRRGKNRIANKTRFVIFLMMLVLIVALIMAKLFWPKLKKEADIVIEDGTNKQTFVENDENTSETEDSEAEKAADRLEEAKAKEEEKKKEKDLVKKVNAMDENGQYNFNLPTNLGEMTYYNQVDTRWGKQTYGPYDPIESHGCGPTVMAEIVNSFTDNSFTPKSMADWAYENGYCAIGNGSLHSLIPDAARNFGLTVEEMYHASGEEVIAKLADGYILVMLSGHGVFSDSDGHFIILTGLNEDGTVNIADSVNVEHNKMKWNIDTLINESNYVSSSGGPFWAIKR